MSKALGLCTIGVPVGNAPTLLTWVDDLRGISDTLVAAYRATGASLTYPTLFPTSLAESKTNYADSGTYNLVGNATWATTGWSGFSATNYFNTNIVVPNTQTWSAFIHYNYTGGSYYPALFGSWTGAFGFAAGYYSWATNTMSFAPSASTGGVGTGGGIVSVALAGNRGYAGASFQTDVVSLSAGTNVLPVFIGCMNYNGVPMRPAGLGFSIKAICFYSSVITDIQGVFGILQNI